MAFEIKLIYIKKYYYLIVLLFLTVSCGNRDNKKVPLKTIGYNAIIEFEKRTHNFEKIPIDTIGTIFRFENKGRNTLVIQHVSSSCGCTIPEWPMNPIEQNEKGIIKVVFDAKEHGHFNKKISVFYNGKDSPIELIIKGEVVDTKEKSPSNEIN